MMNNHTVLKSSSSQGDIYLIVGHTVTSHPEVIRAYQKDTQLQIDFWNLLNIVYFKYLWVNYLIYQNYIL